MGKPEILAPPPVLPADHAPEFSVAFIFRTPRPAFFSIEKVYERVAGLLAGRAITIRHQLPFQQISPWKLFQNIRSLRRLRADLFHITGEVYYVSLFLPRQKLIITIHDCNYVRMRRGARAWLIKRYWMDLPVARSRYVVVISTQTRKELIELTGCNPEKIIVIPNPLPEGFVYTPRPFHAADPLILHIGTRWNKNLERVAEALAGLSVRLLIIGEPTETQKDTLGRHGLRYTFRSGLSESALIAAYQESDMVLFPSLSEGFGLPIIEAQATGRPLVTSNRDPMAEVAGPGACLVDPESVPDIRAAVESIINNATYREEMIQQGLANVERYQAGRITEQYLRLYQSVIRNQIRQPH